MENWFVIVVALYLIGMTLYGYRKGLIRLVLSLFALAITIGAVSILVPRVTDYLREHTTIQSSIEEKVRVLIGLSEEVSQAEEQVPSIQRSIIENLGLPKVIEETLLENNNNEIYRLLGVDRFGDYISNFLSRLLLNAIVFILASPVIYVLVRFCFSCIGFIGNLPLISSVNKGFGAVFGAIQGLVLVWTVFLLLPVFYSFTWSNTLIMQIQSSSWLSYLYENNLLNTWIMNIIKGIL